MADAMKLKLVPSSRSLAAVLCDSNYNKKRHNMIVYSKSKKNDSSNSNSNSNSKPTPTPPRITSNAKQNLRFLKIWKEYQKRKSSTPRPSTSYRKKKAEKEDLADDHTQLYRDPTTSLYYMLREVKVVVVFDAMMSGFPNHKEYSAGIDIVFSSEASADTWIEKEVSALKEDGCPKVWVVTSDHCQQQAAHGAGAFVWSCKALITEIKASQKEVEEMLQEQRSTSFQGRLLKHNLDAEVVDALKNLRQKLSDNELK